VRPLWPFADILQRTHHGRSTCCRLPHAIYSVLLPCISDACRSIGSLKYKHHFGLESFSNPAEHWILQASLTHSMSDALFALSFVSAFNALALAAQGSRGIGFVGDLFGSVGTASCIGFSFSKFPLSTHPTRPRARSTANGHFIFASRHAGFRRTAFCRIALATLAVK
jgi:hypothetical protein